MQWLCGASLAVLLLACASAQQTIDWSDVCANMWCAQYASNIDLETWGSPVAEVYNRYSNTTNISTALLRLAVLETLHQRQLYGKECNGIGERLMWNSATQTTYCVCPYPHNCPSALTTSANTVVISSIAPDSTSDALVIIFSVLGFALLLFGFFEINFSGLLMHNAQDTPTINIVNNTHKASSGAN